MTKFKYIPMTVLTLLVFSSLPAVAHAAQCNFSRDLSDGSAGNDVKCLQQYLNLSGYTIASNGAGSLGHETTTFYDKTQQAVRKWQKANGLPGTGYFGPASRQKYIYLINMASSQTQAASDVATPVLSNADIQAKISAILAQINQLKDKRDKIATDSSKNMANAKESLTDAQSAIDNAQSKINDAYSQGKSVDPSNQLIKDAKAKVKEANRAYKDGRYADSINSTDEIFDLVDRALTKIGVTTVSKSEARDKLAQADNSIKDSETKIAEASKNGKNTDNSEDILNKANSKYSEADNAFNNKDYGKAVSLANEVQSLANDAVNAIGESETSEAERAISSATAALNNAKNAINNSSYSSAISYLSSSKSYVNEAIGSLDSNNYQRAVEYLVNAKNRIVESDKYIDNGGYSNAGNSIINALQELSRASNKL